MPRKRTSWALACLALTVARCGGRSSIDLSIGVDATVRTPVDAPPATEPDGGRADAGPCVVTCEASSNARCLAFACDGEATGVDAMGVCDRAEAGPLTTTCSKAAFDGTNPGCSDGALTHLCFGPLASPPRDGGTLLQCMTSGCFAGSACTGSFVEVAACPTKDLWACCAGAQPGSGIHCVYTPLPEWFQEEQLQAIDLCPEP